jgi:hypothetical protein
MLRGSTLLHNGGDSNPIRVEALKTKITGTVPKHS